MPRVRPERIGPYRIDDVLGSGGMGEVFLAYDERLRRPVAIKQLRSDAMATEDRRIRLRREAQAVALLNHPAIVQVHDIVEEDGVDHVVMEYVDGMPLSSFLDEQSPQLTEILQLAQDIAAGLAEAHSKGIVHRDLKCENILVTPNGRAKILDFGLAKQIWPDDGDDSLSVEGMLIGTSLAMSPEQAEGRPVDHRSDLFALGILLYEMLSGQNPFAGATPLSTIHKVINDAPPPLESLFSHTPDELIILVNQLLEKDPDRRPDHASMVAELLDRLRVVTAGLESGELQVLPPSGTLPTAKPVIRKPAEDDRWSAAVWLTLALLVSAGFGLLFWAKRGETFSTPEPAEPALLVVVPKLFIEGPASENDGQAGAVVRTALLRGLISFEGITTLDPVLVDDRRNSRVPIHQELGNNEQISGSLRPIPGGQVRVELHRTRADGELLGTEAFQAPHSDSRLLADITLTHLRRLYPDHESRGDVLAFEISPMDYKRFLEIREMVLEDQRDTPLPEILAELARIRESSPRFLESYLLEGRLARYLFQLTRDPAMRDRGQAVLTQASQLAPKDPRPLIHRTELALAMKDQERAAEFLKRLEAIEPGDTELLMLYAQLEELRGAAGPARDLYKRAIERNPSIANLMRWADFELRVGYLPKARTALEWVLSIDPDRFEAQQKLAQLELRSGRVDEAADLYEKLVERNASPTALSNLGLCYLLQGKYRQSAECFERAADLRPQQLSFLLNLADSLWLDGQQDEARTLYRQLADRIEEIRQDPNRSIDWELLALESQALAHLSEHEAAAERIEEMLQQSAGDHQAHFTAAVVYTLLGQTENALKFVELAQQDRFFSEAWFRLPWFDSLWNQAADLSPR